MHGKKLFSFHKTFINSPTVSMRRVYDLPRERSSSLLNIICHFTDVLVHMWTFGQSVSAIYIHIYRVSQEESAILSEIIVCVILSKKVHMNMGLILNGYRDYGKKKIRTILRARTAIT